jgi:hypothetical protein
MSKIIFAIIIGGLGVGVGYGVGWVGGVSISGFTNGVTGMCTAIDAGVNQGLFKDAQMGQVGAGMVQLRQQRGQSAEHMEFILQINPSNPSPACQQFREGISKAAS